MSYSKSTNRFGKTLIGIALGLSMAFSSLAVHANDTANTINQVYLPDFTTIVPKVEGSVVNIRTTEAIKVRQPGAGRSGDPYDLFKWFFGPDEFPHGLEPQNRGNNPPTDEERTVPRGVGSGFIISEDGYIITNNHVVANSNGIFVTLTSGKEHKAKIIGADERTDIALIKIEAKDLPALPIGDSNALKKGQWVLAIGSPFGLESTVTTGIVSAINRDTGDYLPFIQTDVAVNPGNSGGPLINLDGQVVGVNSQIVSRSGGFMGISLAIPIDEAMRVVEQLKATGKVSRGRIGVQITDVSDDVATALGLDKAKGALVSKVEPDGPAASAGVKSGDVIIQFNGTDIDKMSDLPRIVGNTKPGKKSELLVWRKGKSVKLKVKVGEMPTETTAQAQTDDTQQQSQVDMLGLSVQELTEQQQKQNDVDGGVIIAQAQDPALSAGLTKGDIIAMVNDQDITSPEQYNKLVSKLPNDKPVALLVMRDNQSQWIIVTPQK